MYTSIKPNNLYLITGGSGFLGAPLIERILNAGGCVRIIARNEGKLIELKEMYPSIEIFTGDIADKGDLAHALKDINAVFHLAAFKHVGMAEDQARRCIRSNTIGSLNLLDLTRDMSLDFIVGVSTDKAAQIAGVYGASKFLMERLFTEFETLNPNTMYRVVRYGNVLYSTGSVLCKWKRLIKEGEEVIVTEPAATRYFWSVEQAIDLIFNCLKHATDASPYVPEMKSMSIGDLLEAMSVKYLPTGKQLKTKIIGLQPGENMHERILEGGISSNNAEKFTVEEILRLI